MPLYLENCTASHCTEFTGAVNLYKKNFSPVLSSDLEGANTLFASFQVARTKTGPISDFCIHDTTAGQIAQSGRNAIRSSCSIQVVKRVGKIILTKQIIGKRDRISIIC